MNRTAVESSNIVSVGYDPKTKLLAVEFKGGNVYEYPDVPAELHKELMAAESIGSFLYNKIRFQYPGKLVTTK